MRLQIPGVGKSFHESEEGSTDQGVCQNEVTFLWSILNCKGYCIFFLIQLFRLIIGLLYISLWIFKCSQTSLFKIAFILKLSGFNENELEWRVLYSNYSLCLRPLSFPYYEFYSYVQKDEGKNTGKKTPNRKRIYVYIKNLHSEISFYQHQRFPQSTINSNLCALVYSLQNSEKLFCTFTFHSIKED